MRKHAMAEVWASQFTLAAALMIHGPLQAQSSQNTGVMVMVGVGTPASCAWPVGITVTNGMAICPTSSGLYYALNGQLPFVPVAPAAIPGPAGPAGPTGATGSAGPQGPAGTSTLPTSEVCTTASISAAGLTASSCTFK